MDDVGKIKSRGFWSFASLIFNSSYSAALGFVAFFILTLKSGVYLIGIYNAVLAMMSFFNYFTNLGLAAALVQKKDIEEKDLSTAFFIQFALTAIVAIVGYFLTNKLFAFYKDLPKNAIGLYWSLLISFSLLSLKTIPSVLLERKVKIYQVVFVQALENTVFYLIIIILSIFGFEIKSLTAAVLIRSILGVVAIYVLNPWFPKITFSWDRAKKLLAFGIPFQGNSFIAMVKDDLLIIYLGNAIGLKNLGYVSFAKKYAEFSIRLITDNINRVSFPIFSRFQKDLKLLRKSLEKVLTYETLLIFPMIVGLLFVFDSLLKIIPGYYLKWSPSLTSFYFFSLSAFFVSLTTPFINLFNSVGHVKLSLMFMTLWTALTWILVPLFIKFFDYNGISYAFFIMSLTFIFVFFTAKHLVEFSFRKAVALPLKAVLFIFIYLLTTRIIFLSVINNFLAHLIVSVFGAVGIYLFIIWKGNGPYIYKEILEIIKKDKNE